MTTLETIAAVARKANLPFLVAGGHAVIAHGYQRATFDVDLAVRRSDRDPWVALLAAAGYSILREASAFVQLNPIPSDPVPVDLMLMNEETFAKLSADAANVHYVSDSLPVISLQHLLGMKCHAIRHGHPGRIVKDVDDVIHLIQANRINVEEPGWRDLILKYGTEELFEKLKRVCRP